MLDSDSRCRYWYPTWPDTRIASACHRFNACQGVRNDSAAVDRGNKNCPSANFCSIRSTQVYDHRRQNSELQIDENSPLDRI